MPALADKLTGFLKLTSCHYLVFKDQITIYYSTLYFLLQLRTHIQTCLIYFFWTVLSTVILCSFINP
jgi:hypothetical protein